MEGGGSKRDHLQLWKIIVGAFVVLAAVTFVAGAAFASSAGTRVDERVDLELTPTEVVSGATGTAELRLRIEEGKMEFRARAEARGLTRDLFSLCVDNGFEAINMTDRGELSLELRIKLETLSGLEVTIREGAGCQGDIVLEGTDPKLADAYAEMPR